VIPAAKTCRDGVHGRSIRLAAAFVLFAASATAQTDAPGSVRPGRPFGNLFGGARSDPARRSTFDLSLALVGGYDQNAAAAASGSGGTIDPRFGVSSGVGSASASVVYERTRHENSLFAGGRTGFRYYPSQTGLNAADVGGSLGWNRRLSQRVRFSASADAAYQPFLSLLAIPVFPGAGLPSETSDYGFAQRPSLVYGASADATFDISRRTHVVADYSFRGFSLVRSSDEGRLRDQSARVGLSRTVTRRVVVGARYNVGTSDGAYTGPGVVTRTQGGEVNVDYRRALRSRRSVGIGLSVGYSELESRRTGANWRADGQLIASVRFSGDLGRSWNASADYRRGMRRLPGIVDPVFSDDVQLRVSGLIGRRFDMTVSGLYSKGSTRGGDWTGYDSTGGTLQIRWAVSRNTALRGDYLYYRNAFPVLSTVPSGFDRRVVRNALRVGLDVWLPLNRRGGR
jgi:hypothetical protein